jgi:hypothetical protein
MNEITPCRACEAQMKMRRLARPHTNLSVLASKAFLGATYEGYEAYIFKCRTCGTLMHYTNDRRERGPFWSVIEKVPDYL